MDDELQTIEAELKRLRPIAPARGVAKRIEPQLARRAGRSRRAYWLWAVTLPAAAAVAVLLWPSARRDAIERTSENPIAATAAEPGMVSEPALRPVAVENVLYAAQDEGLVTLADGTPARRQRLSYVDTITWRDSRTNASLRWTVPREEVRVVPIFFQ
ncbi:MAG: hypothetical protein Q7S40_07245 [Opitutaceae bacterium]|nr:hypothetical protein [Opitutaceae bacterium]